MLSPSQHFYIHYDIDGNDGLDLIDDSGNGIPDYIDNVGIFADSAYYMLKDKMGYEVEPADAPMTIRNRRISKVTVGQGFPV